MLNLAQSSFRRALLTAVVAISGCEGNSSVPTPLVEGQQDGHSARPQMAEMAKRERFGGSLRVSGRRTDSQAPSVAAAPRFTDVRAELGIDFQYQNGAVGKALMVEATGGGAGWLDYDRDGASDLYLVQGGNPAWKSASENESDELFRGVSGGPFRKVTQPSRIDERGYSQGVAIADYDNDGFPDIYVTNVGQNTFFRNLGDGTFREATDESGLIATKWNSSAAWGDLDQDGDLDLYLCTYVMYDPYHPHPCFTGDGRPTTCHPEEMNPLPDLCFENLGDGTFRDVAEEWGLVGEGSKSLGVVIADFNDDLRPDIYVANDTTANFLFINTGPRKFEERGIPLGCALSGDGLFQASMGVAFGDFDGNGHPDLYVTHFTNDYNTLYANLGTNGFHDATQATGLVAPTLKYLGFGTVMVDFDRNGSQDLFVANGHIDDYRKDGLLFRMPPQLFTFSGGRFHECTSRAGDYFQGEYLGRAVATCDMDNDGDVDLAVVNQNAPTAILRNEATAGHWCRFRFLGTTSNRDGGLAKVKLRQGSRELAQQLAGGTSYCASHEPVLQFGLPSDEPCDIEVLWPSGIRQTLEKIAVDQTMLLQEPAAEQ